MQRKVLFCHPEFISRSILIFIFLYFGVVNATSIDGTSGVVTKSSHYVFRDGDTATGFVRFGNGFTIVPGTNHASNMCLDTCISVSGGVDLRSTSTLTLLGDLTLDNDITFSSSGYIKSYGSHINLGGNLTIQRDTVLHCRGQLIIDGNGHTLYLNPHAQLFLDDAATVTLRNMVISTSLDFPGQPAINLATPSTKLALDDVELALGNDFNFKQGQLFIHNDVAVTGTSAFIYSSTVPSYIASHGCWYFDLGTTFSYAPASTSNDLIVMSDASSELALNGCTLKATHTGMRLTKGRMFFDNKVTVNDINENKINTTTPCTQVGSNVTTGNYPRAVSWSPDGKYIAVVNANGYTLQIFLFSGATPVQVGSSVATGTGPLSVVWSPDGKYIAVVNYWSDTLQIFAFSGGTPVQVGSNVTTGTRAYSVAWSPDGKYIAVVNYISNTLRIFAFSGGTPVQVGSDVTTSDNPTEVVWSPDGKYIAVVNQGGHTLQVFAFSGGTPVQVGSAVATGSDPFSVSWSPDGKYIAVSHYGGAAFNVLQVFSFSGTTPTQVGSNVTTEAQPQSCAWSPDGKYIVVVTFAGQAIQIFSFLGGTPTQVGSNVSTSGKAHSYCPWSPNGRYIVVIIPESNILQVFSVNYQPDTSTPTLSNCITLGNSAQGATADVAVHVLGRARVEVTGMVNHDAAT